MLHVSPNTHVLVRFDRNIERYRAMGKEAARDCYIPELTRRIAQQWHEGDPFACLDFNISPDDPLFRTVQRPEYLEAVREALMYHFKLKYVTVAPPHDSNPFLEITLYRKGWVYKLFQMGAMLKRGWDNALKLLIR